MKNKVLVIFLFILTVAFFGCNSLGREINTQFIDFNIEEDYSKIEPTQYLEYYKKNFEIYNDSSIPLITVKSGNSLGIYSILEDDLILDFKENVTIDYIVNYYFPNYFKVIYPDNSLELYDYNGSMILRKGEYKNLRLEVSRIRDKQNWIFNEKITYIQNNKTTTINYQSFNDLKNRKLVSDNDNLIQGDKITFIPRGIDLEEIGLPGYYLIELNDNFVQIYNSKNQLVSTVNLNFDYQYAVSFGGCIIYQKVLLLDNDEKEFDYAVEVNNDLLKYDLITYKLDLKKGDIKELDVDFIISDGTSCKDKEGIFNYANVKLKFIENKRLMPSQQFIIDDDCNIVYNFSNAISLESLIRLDSNHYFDYGSNKLYDGKMNLIFDFNNNDYDITFESFDFGNKLIKCLNDNKYGFINYDLEVIIPFDYDYLGDYFISNYTYGVINDINYLIKIDGEILETNFNIILNCPLLYDITEENGLFRFQIYTYDNQKVLEYLSDINSLPLIYKSNFNNQNYYYFIGKEVIVKDNIHSYQDIIFTVVVNDLYD